MHEVNANDVVIDVFDNCHWMHKLPAPDGHRWFKYPNELIFDPLAATHPVPLCNSLGRLQLNA